MKDGCLTAEDLLFPLPIKRKRDDEVVGIADTERDVIRFRPLQGCAFDEEVYALFIDPETGLRYCIDLGFMLDDSYRRFYLQESGKELTFTRAGSGA